MHLIIVTPNGSKVDIDVSMVTLPGVMGELGILPGHRPLISALAVGALSFIESGKTRSLAVNSGFAEVHDDVVTVVTQTAETPDEIDAERAKRSLDRAEEAMKTLDPHSDETAWKHAQERRQRALTRLALTRLATPEALRARAS